MAKHKRQRGISLTEILVVIGVMAILMGVSIPAAKQLMVSFESSTGVRHLINAALANARAIAVREQTYAGVRLQQAKDGSGYYLVLIEHDPTPGPAYGFYAVAGRKPMKLPQDVIVSRTTIVFSPAGKLTTHRVQCLPASVYDNVFNTALSSALFNNDTGSPLSDQSITIGSLSDPTLSTTNYISPYTGELVMEYRE